MVSVRRVFAATLIVVCRFRQAPWFNADPDVGHRMLPDIAGLVLRVQFG